MNWIFDNMQVVIVIASAFAWWLNKRREDAALDEQTPPSKQSNEDHAEVERRRKIQEEIRRKIAERRGEVAPASPQDRSPRPSPQSTQPVEPEEPDIPPFLRELMGMPERRPVAPRVEPPPMPTITPGFDRQAEMQVELRKLEEKKKEAEAMSANFRAASSRTGGRKRRPISDSGDSGRDLLATLRDSKSARRAIVLREILDKPVALR